MAEYLGTTGDVISQIIGWIYFLAWTISFYPQIWTNFRRKSVVGLSFDYVLYNIIGFASYSAFNVAFFFSSTIQQEYMDENDGKANLVAINDVFFALHAVAATLVVIIQIIIYERGEQKVSKTSIFISSCLILSIIIVSIIAGAKVVLWIFFFYYLSYVKLAISFIKYCPQVWLNFRRKSTEGWNIWNVLLDFTGGLLSVAQLLFDSWRTNNWQGTIGNPVKFGLGFLSMGFDIIFIVQHYVLYRKPKGGYKVLDENFDDSDGSIQQKQQQQYSEESQKEV